MTELEVHHHHRHNHQQYQYKSTIADPRFPSPHHGHTPSFPDAPHSADGIPEHSIMSSRDTLAPIVRQPLSESDN